MDDVQLVPMLVIHPSVKLTTPVRTDGYHKGATPNFLAQAYELRFVEFLRTVDGEAPGRPAQDMD